MVFPPTPRTYEGLRSESNSPLLRKEVESHLELNEKLDSWMGMRQGGKGEVGESTCSCDFEECRHDQPTELRL